MTNLDRACIWVMFVLVLLHASGTIGLQWTLCAALVVATVQIVAIAMNAIAVIARDTDKTARAAGQLFIDYATEGLSAKGRITDATRWERLLQLWKLMNAQQKEAILNRYRASFPSFVKDLEERAS